MVKYAQQSLVLVFALMLAAAGARAHAADLLGVRFGPGAAETRIVFDLNGDAAYSVSGDETGNGRLLVDFQVLSVSLADREFRPGKGHVERYGFAATPSGAERAVLEFKKTAKIKQVFMIPPGNGVAKHRLVIDITTSDMQGFLASLPQRYPDLAAMIEEATTDPALRREAPITRQAPAIPPAIVEGPSAPSLKPQPAKPQTVMKTVVIDAGHGGADPGAQGQSGTLEKNVTLAAALELASILKATGRYKVVLTRDDDSKIKPDRREEMARTAGADLFISLHADAIGRPAVRGASIYTLSEKGSARSASLAKSQGNYHVYNLDLKDYDKVIGDILLDKAQDETNTASSRFAEMLIDQLSGKTQMLNRSHRTADLRVLLAPDVPAVLLEMAFISNAKDEANLNSPVWRQRTMGAVAEAIDQYFADPGGKRYAANRADRR